MLVKVIGLDIGGANTKAAFLRTKDGVATEIKTAVEYFPVWKEKNKLAKMLLALKERLCGKMQFDGVGVTMTAELSDAYQTKREGINHILSCVTKTFVDVPLFVLDVDATLIPISTAKMAPLRVAAANWAATGWMVSQLLKSCVIVDIGSTSTSIIPIVNGRVAAEGKTDLEKLMCGELVYTGSLRTNVAAIVNSVPIRNGYARVSSELFALSADVHLILGNITKKDYTSETADGRGKTVREAMARLARVVCADIEMLTEQEIRQIARYIYSKQVEQVAESLSKVYSRVKAFVNTEVPVVITGIGKNFLAGVAAEKVGADKIIDLADLLKDDVTAASPAVGVALMTASQLEGCVAKWTL
ncbi:MAG: H4MPT-linked C1 transfer pathway protein [Candidatus Bathyarchaeota archaeon]|nr:H4MPT-linked C1 transfer pathway protein [Candidatus Bathyarchaeota archaeon]